MSNLRIKIDAIYRHKGNGNNYRLQHMASVKQSDGSWETGVSYTNEVSHYVRTLENFRDRFEWVREDIHVHDFTGPKGGPRQCVSCGDMEPAGDDG